MNSRSTTKMFGLPSEDLGKKKSVATRSSANKYFKYQMNSNEFFENPFAVWRQMHLDGPVVRSRIPLIGRMWFATSWRAVSDVLKDQDRFARDVRRAGRSGQLPFWMNWIMPRKFKMLANNNILTSDHEDHRRLRFLVDEAFRRTEIQSLMPRIEKVSERFLSELAAQAKQNNGIVDLSSRYSRQLPLAIICEVLGLPEEDQANFKKWFRAFAEIRSFGSLFKVIPGINKLLDYLKDRFEKVRNNPEPGLISSLVQIEQEGERLSGEELTSLVFVLLVAGHETTVHLINSAVRILLQHESERLRLMADWSLMDSAIDEILRYDSTVYFSKPRFIVEDCEFHGASLKRGESIVAILGAANADPEQFVNPEVLDISRPKNYHMTFGSGPHVCLGMKLAKAECAVALQQLFTQFPNMVLADYKWQRRIGMMGMKYLNLRLR